MKLNTDCNGFRRQVRKWIENEWKLLKVVLLKGKNNCVEAIEILWVEEIVPEEKKIIWHIQIIIFIIQLPGIWIEREKWQKIWVIKQRPDYKGTFRSNKSMEFIQCNEKPLTCFKQRNDMIRIWFRNIIPAAVEEYIRQVQMWKKMDWLRGCVVIKVRERNYFN